MFNLKGVVCSNESTKNYHTTPQSSVVFLLIVLVLLPKPDCFGSLSQHGLWSQHLAVFSEKTSKTSKTSLCATCLQQRQTDKVST